MKKYLFLVFSFTASLASLHAATGQKSALTLRANALLKNSAQESLAYLTSSIGLASSDEEKRSILYYTGTLQEQLGMYADASVSYSAAAAIDAKDARGMPPVTNARLYLNAARTSLAAGDHETASACLAAAPLRSTTDAEERALCRLYAVWVSLSQADGYDEAADAISLLTSYSDDSSMKSVRPTVLLTLWHVTERQEYAERLAQLYPNSPEAGVVNGSVQAMGMPFWYFVPRVALETSETLSLVPQQPTPPPQAAAQKPEPVATIHDTVVLSDSAPAVQSAPAASSGKPGGKVRQQLGFFRERDNADALIGRLQKQGFAAYCYPEQRASGTTYYVVVVDENEDGSMGRRLRAAGFECYQVVD